MSNTYHNDPLWYMFVAGGVGEAMAACVSHPLDVVKVRRQLAGELSAAKQPSGLTPIIRTFVDVARTEGVFPIFARQGLWYGVSASVARQLVFSTLRHGTFGAAKQAHGKMGLPEEVVAAATIGGVSAAIANPCDVVLVRMQADGHWPAAKRRGYRHVFDGLQQTVRHEGVGALWRGCAPTVTRAMLVTASQLPSYGVCKRWLLSKGFSDSIGTHFAASTFSGLVATVVTCPVDVVKTRIMNMRSPGRDGAAQYTSAFNCAVATVHIEGLRGLYKGFAATFVRQTPHTILLWMFQEQWLRVLRGRGARQQTEGAARPSERGQQ
jgi:solute carrier family 25 oxoglutarate transporter 11